MYAAMIRRILLSVILVANLFVFKLAAIEDFKLNFERIDNTLGLPSNEIRRVYQDQQGYLWFGSKNGLIRYDGYNFVMMQNSILHPNLLTFNAVMSLTDDQNYLWVGTESGLNRWNKKLHSMEKVDCSILNSARIEKILITSKAFFLIGTNKGLFKYYPNENKVDRLFANTLVSGVIDLLQDNKGRIWIATWEKGLFCFDIETNQIVQYPKVGEKNSVHTLFQDRSGNIWLGTWGNGLLKIKNDNDPSITSYQLFLPSSDPKSIGSDIVYSINQDSKKGYLWVGHRRGLSILKDINNPNSFQNYSNDNNNKSLIDNDVNAICKDRSGIMWLGLLRGGVCKVNIDLEKLYFNSLDQINPKTHNRGVYTMWFDKLKTLWLGVNNSGVYLYDTKTSDYKDVSEVVYPKKLKTSFNVLDLVYIKRFNEMWISFFDGGVMRIKLNAEKNPVASTPIDKSICDSKVVNRIYEDRRGNVWLLANNGLYTFLKNGKQLKQLGSNYQSASEDKFGNIWFGTQKDGVVKASLVNNALKLDCFSEKNHQISNNNVLSILVDHAQQVWAATNGGGLACYNQKENQFECVNYKYNIPYNILFNLFEDRYNNIWCVNENALLRIDKSRNGKVHLFSSSDGLWNNVFWPSCLPVQLDSVRYAIGGAHGYNVLEVNKMGVNKYIPQVQINDLLVNGVSIYSNELKSQIDTISQKIKLSHNQNSFTLEFAALCYRNSKNNSYAFRLSGFEKEWRYANASMRYVNYTNIPAGNYCFEVKASNENGIWNETPTKLTISVLTSPFLSWYAWLFYLSILFFIAYTVYKNLSRSILLKRQVEISEIEKQTSEKLTQTKLRFFTNISHELLTPLTILGCVVDEIKKNNRVELEQTEVMSNNISRLIRLIRQILEFRKAESDNLRLKVGYGNVSEFIRVISDVNFRPMNEKRQIHFSIISNPKYIMGYYDSDKLEKIIYNLLSNAFKYNKLNGFVQVSLNEVNVNSERSITITVKDSGIGVADEKVSNIFNRFYDGDYRKQEETGTGIGLWLTKTLIELYHGSITVESQLGIGTEFVVTLPLDAASYKLTEIDEHSTEVPDEDQNEESDKKLIFNEEFQTILLVDDNQELLRVVAEPLRDIYNVVTAENGYDALEKIALYPVDMVVSDVMMPEMDGFTLCKKLKSEIETSHIPVILLTAKSMEEDKIQGYESGADSYITKPFKPSLLLTRIAGVFRNRDQNATKFNRQDTPVISNLDISKIDQQFLLKAIQVVEENLDNADFDSDQFESSLNVTTSTLYRKIKSITGSAPNDFIRNIRLKRSCQLLQASEMNISEVAYAVGFNDPKYFARCFKKEFGKTPGQYQKESSVLDQIVVTENE